MRADRVGARRGAARPRTSGRGGAWIGAAALAVLLVAGPPPAAVPGTAWGWSAKAFAAEAVVAFDDEADRDRYERLLREYRCLKCQNQNLSDSGASLAGDLREQIRTRVVAGDDDAAIDEYLVSRYGEFVRYRPRFGTQTALLWIGPFALLAIGLGAGVVMARRGSSGDGAPVAAETPAAGASPAGGGAERERLDEARRLLADEPRGPAS